MIDYFGPKTNDEDYEINKTIEYSALDRSYKVKIDLLSNDKVKIDELESIMAQVVSKLLEVDGGKHEASLYDKIKSIEELVKNYGKDS